MQVRWKQLLVQFLIWSLAEIVLTFIGIDDLADYSEYRLAAKHGSIAPIIFIV